MHPERFDEQHTLHELRHYLPTQTPLKDFIHHNSLHAFQHLPFYEAIFRAAAIFGYQATLPLPDYRRLFETGRIRENILEQVIRTRKGDHDLGFWKHSALLKSYDDSVRPRTGRLRLVWKDACWLDLDNLVQPLLFRVLCSYLDQGIALWEFPHNGKGFLASLAELERNSFTSLFRRSRARKLLLDGPPGITELLGLLVGDETRYEQYLFDQQFSHRGWSGIVSAVETRPDTLLSPRVISLHDLIIFELLLEIDALDAELGDDWKPLKQYELPPTADLFGPEPVSEFQEVLMIWQDAFEWSYYDNVLAGIRFNQEQGRPQPAEKSLQAVFCIDERECSLRRHLEHTDPSCETLGSPGFFGVEFFYQPEHAKFYDKLCPAPVTPKYLIKAYHSSRKHGHEALYHGKTHRMLSGFLSTITLGFWAGVKLVQHLLRPKMSPAISNAFGHMDKTCQLSIENLSPTHIENGLQVGFTVDEMALRVENLLRSIGLVRDFAPLVYIVGHGSSSANNPHHGAHDCGACSGRPGSVNARVFAHMANHAGVRNILAGHGLIIPDSTQFMGALHDTAADEIEYYDTEVLSEANRQRHRVNAENFERALDLNAKERSRRFASIDTRADIKSIRRAIKDRSVSLFEPRPELGHGTNTLCIVGHRNLTRGLFLDRRAFLNSYDYRTDPNGDLLTGVMRPLGPVCGGINLEYYFSRVDNQKLGAGTKLPHNVMGLFGVANSSDGDLRPGLPWQMIEVHDPVRLLIIVEHFPEVVLRCIQSSPEMYEWYKNAWVHVAAIHPETREAHYFRDGRFEPYRPLTNRVELFADIHHLLENAREMETNYIADATRENLPVYLHKD